MQQYFNARKGQINWSSESEVNMKDLSVHDYVHQISIDAVPFILMHAFYIDAVPFTSLDLEMHRHTHESSKI